MEAVVPGSRLSFAIPKSLLNISRSAVKISSLSQYVPMLLLLLRPPAISLGFIILGEIFAYVTFF